MSREWEDKHSLGENICKRQSDKGLLSKIHKDLLKLNNKSKSNPVKKMVQRP